MNAESAEKSVAITIRFKWRFWTPNSLVKSDFLPSMLIAGRHFNGDV